MSTVTVVIPTRNRPRLVERAVGVATRQQGVSVDVVVVDDGSDHDTVGLVERLAGRGVRVLRHRRPRGVSAARNTGIAAADGEWIAFLDDDDLWAPDKLSGQIGAAADSGSQWSFTGAVTVDESLRVIGGGPPPDPAVTVASLLYRNIVPAGSSNVAVRREPLARSGGFDESLRHMGDWDLWIRLSREGPPTVVDRPLVAYVVHAGNASLDRDGIITEMRRIESRWSEDRRGAPIDRAYVHRWMGWSALRSGDRRAALGAYRRAAREGDALSLGRMVAAAVLPTGVAPVRHRVPPSYVRQAEQWLLPHGG